MHCLKHAAVRTYIYIHEKFETHTSVLFKIILGTEVVTLGHIHVLIGLNCQKWRDQVEFYMSMNQNMDLFFNEEQPEELDGQQC